MIERILLATFVLIGIPYLVIAIFGDVFSKSADFILTAAFKYGFGDKRGLKYITGGLRSPLVAIGLLPYCGAFVYSLRFIRSEIFNLEPESMSGLCALGYLFTAIWLYVFILEITGRFLMPALAAPQDSPPSIGHTSASESSLQKGSRPRG